MNEPPSPSPDINDPSDAAFIDAHFGEDDLGVVIRAHIHVEAKLLELLDVLVVDPKPLEQMRLSFGQRINLAVALGLKPEHAPALSAFGRLRNAFAHRLNTKLSDDQVNSLYGAMSAGDKEVVQTAYERTKVQMSTPELSSFKELSTKSRFILISVAIRGMLLPAIGDARARRRQGFASLGD